MTDTSTDGSVELTAEEAALAAHAVDLWRIMRNTPDVDQPLADLAARLRATS